MSRLRTERRALAFHLRLTPRGGRDAIEGWIACADGREHLKVRVSAPPEDGKANAALLALLARALEVPKSAIQIVAGENARLKTVAIHSTSPELATRLSTWGDRT
jgi:hypothetical protein